MFEYDVGLTSDGEANAVIDLVTRLLTRRYTPTADTDVVPDDGPTLTPHVPTTWSRWKKTVVTND